MVNYGDAILVHYSSKGILSDITDIISSKRFWGSKIAPWFKCSPNVVSNSKRSGALLVLSRSKCVYNFWDTINIRGVDFYPQIAGVAAVFYSKKARAHLTNCLRTETKGNQVCP